MNAPVLSHPTAKGKSKVHVDASGVGLGVVLMQSNLTTNEFHPISYLSRRLTTAEAHNHSNELECLALVWALTKLRLYRCDGVLYRKGDANQRKFRLVVPSLLRRDILSNCQDPPDSGHFSIFKTKEKVSQNYWWPGLLLSVKTYVSACPFFSKE